jgi:hypothetical protein
MKHPGSSESELPFSLNEDRCLAHISGIPLSVGQSFMNRAHPRGAPFLCVSLMFVLINVNET